MSFTWLAAASRSRLVVLLFLFLWVGVDGGAAGGRTAGGWTTNMSDRQTTVMGHTLNPTLELVHHSTNE
jgi:hypothetical protein